MNGIMIAATGSGSGKTLITCALLSALKNRGLKPHAFKCGPDYIDPMYHRTVLNIPSNNLDLFFVDDEKLRELYTENVQDSDIAVIEGVMGLYDGISTASEEGSAYHIASVLNLPVILVVDAHGMGRSILPLIKGFLEYDKEKRIAGIFLNKISENFYKKIAPLIESEFDISVVGFLPNNSEFSFASRHLGLRLPYEIPLLKDQIENAAGILDKNGSVENIIKLAVETEQSDLNKSPDNTINICSNNINIYDTQAVKIGVARDEAFCFYYEENLRMLEKYGAKLIFFSPLHDSSLPQGLDAIILGGGYPEIYAEKLSENESMRLSVKAAIAGGMPSVAECGGFMYLHEALKDDSGNEFAMCGVIPGACFNTGTLVRFGYVNITEKYANYLEPDGIIKGHEFHYYDSEYNGNDCIASKPLKSIVRECIFDTESHFWGFPHLYYPSNPEFVIKFIKKAQVYHILENSYKFFKNTDCKYYPCHKGIDEINCLFCYCPFYLKDKCPGTPEFKEKDGRIIKICTSCIFPHKEDNYDSIIRMLKD